MSSRKLLISLVPAVLAVAALGVGASSASAAACTVNVLCNNSNEKLRDDLTEPPEGISGGGYGTSALAVNTAGSLRLCMTIAGLKTCNESPTGYVFFGVKLHSNPLTVAAGTTCKAGLGEAKGWVTFVDWMHYTPSAVYDNTSPGYNGAWPIGVRSDKCSAATNPGKVTIERAALFFPALANLVATGTFTGKWVQPGECPGGSGGVKLDVKQEGIKLSAGEKPELDNGTAHTNAFICFVASSNYLYPNAAPTWAPFTGNIWKD
jgi:hypothetical protein